MVQVVPVVGTTRGVQKALGPRFQAACGTQILPRALSFGANQVCLGSSPRCPHPGSLWGETGHHTAASHHKPSLLPPALGPSHLVPARALLAPLPGTPSHGRSSSTQSKF